MVEAFFSSPYYYILDSVTIASPRPLSSSNLHSTRKITCICRSSRLISYISGCRGTVQVLSASLGLTGATYLRQDILLSFVMSTAIRTHSPLLRPIVHKYTNSRALESKKYRGDMSVELVDML